jgi:leucyl aminopeptidase
MEVTVTAKPEGDVIGVATADGALAGEEGRLLEAEGFRPEAGAATLLHLDGRRIAVAGLGDEVDADAFRTAAAAVARLAKHIGGTLAWRLEEGSSVPVEDQARAVVDGVLLGGYDPGRWKSGERPVEFSRLSFTGSESLLETAQRAATVAKWANKARDLANEPPNQLTPAALAERAEEIAAGSDRLTAESGGPERLAELGMGSFGAVAQGSDNPPRLIVLRYDPPDARDDLVLGLVGKAVTFDTGGISIKPALYMEDMKGDMEPPCWRGSARSRSSGFPCGSSASSGRRRTCPAGTRIAPATSSLQ